MILKAKKQHQNSLFKKILIPLVIIMLFQSILFFAGTYWGGITTAIHKNAEDILKERVINQETGLETRFANQWTNFTVPANNIQALYQNITESGNVALYQDEDKQKQLLQESRDTMVKMLRDNGVTGVFLVLNNDADYHQRQEGESQQNYGLCFRDYSPESEYTLNEDLLAVRCPSSMIADMGFSMETWWNAKFVFQDDVPGDYYYKPLQMAYENPGADFRDLAYFDGTHNFGGADRPVVSYSVPLMDAQGYPYAILGVEMTVDYLKTLIPSGTLYADNASCYALVQYHENSNSYQVIATDGTLYQQCFGNEETFQSDENSGSMIRLKGTKNDMALAASLVDMKIYNTNTPYEDEKFALMGIVREDNLYSINRVLGQRLIQITMLVMLFGIISALFISRRLTSPINKLAQKARQMDGTETPKLERLHIDEIDGLVDSIEDLSVKINRTAIRMEFFSRMSHDMRTPMNAIIGFSSPEMLEGADPAMMREYLDKINSSGHYLLTLINEVLDMAKVEMQHMELHQEPVTREQLLSAVVPIITEVAKKKGVIFTLDMDESHFVYSIDAQRLSQVLMNLLSNAVKFSDAGQQVILKIEEMHHTEKESTIRYRVIDHGSGMSEEFQKKMYEPFSQEGHAKGGTGLGLAIANQIVTLMGGTLTCHSVEGKGTTFDVVITHTIVKELPENAEASSLQQGETEKKEEANIQKKQIQGKRVLLCEDHPLNAQIATRLLQQWGIIVEPAEDGVIGVDKFKSSPAYYFDLILMDIRMPNMNGLECARTIRGLQRQDAKTIPIIAMTANAFREDMEQSEAAGMNAHLSKPIDPKILRDTLVEFIGEE